MPKLTQISVIAFVGLTVAASVGNAKKNKPADGAGSDSDHIPVQMALRDAATDGIVSDNTTSAAPYTHEVDNVLCDLNSPGSLICNSTDFKRREGIRMLEFRNLPELGTIKVPFRMTTTFCSVRDLEDGSPTTCNLNFRFDDLGETYTLRFDGNATEGGKNATQVTAHCDTLGAMTGECTKFRITTDDVENPAAVLYRSGRGGRLEMLGVFEFEVEIYAEILQ